MSNNYWIESYDVILLWNEADKKNDISDVEKIKNVHVPGMTTRGILPLIVGTVMYMLVSVCLFRAV